MLDKKFEFFKKDDYTLININVEKLDTQVSPEIKTEIIVIAGGGVKNMIIDLSKTRYCDSSGLSTILVAFRFCKNAGGILVLTGLQKAVERLIKISRLDDVFNIVNNLDEAIELIEKNKE